MAPFRAVLIQAVVATEVPDSRRERGKGIITLLDPVKGQQVAQCHLATGEKGIIHSLTARLTLGTLCRCFSADNVHISSY